MFDIDQHIYILEDGTAMCAAVVPMEDLGKTIATLGESERVTSAHLIGDSSYGKEIIDSINKYCLEHYDNFTMQVTIN
jgi:hypothetical protein